MRWIVNRYLLFSVSMIVSGFISASLFGSTSYTWSGGTSTDWTNDLNWGGAGASAYPHLQGDIASFSVASPVNQPNVPNATIYVGSISFSSSSSTTISGVAEQLNLEASSGNAVISSTVSSNTISTGLNLISPLVISVDQNNSLNLSGLLSGTVSSVTILGPGTTMFSYTAIQNPLTVSSGIFVNSGVLQIASDGALGNGSNSLNLSGTLQPSSNISLGFGRTITTSTGAIIDSNGFNFTIQGLITGTSLSIQGQAATGYVNLFDTSNTYTGGTTVNSGILMISADGCLGAASGALSLMNNTTLQASGAFSLQSSRPVILSGSTTIHTAGFSPTIASSMSGSTSTALIVTGNPGDVLTLTGQNSYAGATTVDSVTVVGSTSSIQGNFTLGSGGVLTFNQATAGTYAGILGGALGTVVNFQGGGIYTLTNNSSAASFNVQVNSATLNLEGSLGASTCTIFPSSSLTGIGTLDTISSLQVNGVLAPGNITTASGFLTVHGNSNFGVGSQLDITVTPSSNTALYQASGTANLNNAILSVNVNPNYFYALDTSYTIVNGVNSGSFSSVSISSSHFASSIDYFPLTSVVLHLQNLQPFVDFPFKNKNEEAVGNNLDTLIAQGSLSPDLSYVLDSLNGLSVSQVDQALDEMHPAALGAIADLQVELGGQLLNLYHRQFLSGCKCNRTNVIWVEPFGNWLREKHQGMQIGFRATSRGVALGIEHQFLDCWTIGVGGAYSKTDLKWSLHRGYNYIDSAYAVLYSDVSVGDFYLGGSGYFGKDFYQNHRHMQFSTINRTAVSSSHALDLGGQISTAYFFGTRSAIYYPYATVDYLYLKNSSFSEKEANSLNLSVDAYESSNLRVEAGGCFKFKDSNLAQTVCVTPLFSFGYVLEKPLHRDRFKAVFAGQDVSFITVGRHQAWQLLNVKFGLGISYYCFTLDSQYSADISPEGNSPFFNQRGNFRFSYSF